MMSGVPLQQWNGSDATDRLTAVIQKHIEKTEIQSKILVRLTWAIAGLTVVMVVIAIAEAWPG